MRRTGCSARKLARLVDVLSDLGPVCARLRASRPRLEAGLARPPQRPGSVRRRPNHNWRLTLVQVLPAMWIWAAMFDLKAHVLHGKSFQELTGPAVVIPLVLGVAVVTAASFYLNAVFAFAITQPGQPKIRPAFTQARRPCPSSRPGRGHRHPARPVRRGRAPLGAALVRGVARHRRGDDDGVLRRLPSRLVGIKPVQSKRDKLTATAVGGAVGAVICTPPYALGRLGLVLLGSHTWFVLGIILFAVGLTLQAGATGAVKTVKMSAKLVSGTRIGSTEEIAGQQGRP